jgi:hypothetical protein
MKFKKHPSNKYLSKGKPKEDKVVIAEEEYETPEVTIFICNYCNRDLIKLSDGNGNNVSWYCNNCSIPFEPENEPIRHKQKLEVPDRNVEPAIATTPGIPDISIRHTPPIRGGFAELQKKGLRIKDYHTTEKE